MSADTLARIGNDMVPVTRDQFYAAINPLNVHPNPVNKWDEEIGYLSGWTLSGGAGRLIGWSTSGPGWDKPGSSKSYWLAKDIAKATGTTP